MADNSVRTPGSGETIASDEVVDATLGTVKVQYVKLMDGTLDGTGKPGADATNGLDVDVTRLPALVAGSANIGDVDVLTLPALPAGSNNIGDVDVLSGPLGANSLQIQGSVAHDSAAANNPILGGAKAVNAEPTAVANADVAMLLTDLVGKLLVLPYANPENFLSGVTAAITGTSDTAIIAAQGAGVRIYVTQILVTNSHATVGTVVAIKDGTTIIYQGYAAPAGGGFALTFPVPLRITANTALNAANITTGSNTYVSASGYKGV